MQSQQTETPETEEYNSTENLIDESVKTYKINIVGYNGPGKLKPQMQYPLNLSGVQIPCEFYLEKAPSGTRIEGNELFTGSVGGTIVICGKGDGFNVEPRTLEVEGKEMDSMSNQVEVEMVKTKKESEKLKSNRYETGAER
jgi:hypothetical protein